MKTFALILVRDTNIAGVMFPAGFQVGAITSEANPFDLLGLVNFGHAKIEEVTDAEDDSPSLDEEEPEEVENPEASAVEPAAAAEQSESAAEDTAEESASSPATQAESIAAFVADGLDEKTARALVVTNNISSPSELKAKLSDASFNLAELEEIGKSRQEKIMATYLA